MSKIMMHCISLNPNHLKAIEQLDYIPVGLGDKFFSNKWMTDKEGNNISNKNKFYGEYTFHYWIWKNYLEKLSNHNWIGFCQYRKFWTHQSITEENITFDKLKNSVLKTINLDETFETIIGEPFYVNQFRFSKFIKKCFKKMIFSPSLFFNKNKRNIKFHFDMMHGEGNIEKAINLLNDEDRNDFREFINTNISFNPHNMFICKSKNILKGYYDSVFPWLSRCENEFGFNNLSGYGLQRIYGFLAERYMSFWFKKYTKYKVMPIYFKDITDFNL